MRPLPLQCAYRCPPPPWHNAGQSCIFSSCPFTEHRCLGFHSGASLPLSSVCVSHLPHRYGRPAVLVQPCALRVSIIPACAFSPCPFPCLLPPLAGSSLSLLLPSPACTLGGGQPGCKHFDNVQVVSPDCCSPLEQLSHAPFARCCCPIVETCTLRVQEVHASRRCRVCRAQVHSTRNPTAFSAPRIQSCRHALPAAP